MTGTRFVRFVSFATITVALAGCSDGLTLSPPSSLAPSGPSRDHHLGQSQPEYGTLITLNSSGQYVVESWSDAELGYQTVNVRANVYYGSVQSCGEEVPLMLWGQESQGAYAQGPPRQSA